MKSILTITFIFLFFCFACKENSHGHFLVNQVENLVETNPDSAYSLLNNVVIPDRLDDDLFAYWCLLLGRVANDLHKDMPYTLFLLQAREWYEQYGTPNEQSEIGLYLGRSYMEEKKYNEAMTVFLSTLNIAKDAEEYNWAGYICSYIADLYEFKDMFEQARKKYQEGAEYFF